MKLYIVGPGKDGMGTGEGPYHLVTENGMALASHFCSNIKFAKADLISRRPEMIEKWEKEFGELDVLFIGEDDMTTKQLIELNRRHSDLE